MRISGAQKGIQEPHRQKLGFFEYLEFQYRLRVSGIISFTFALHRANHS